jgi:hypothetical protein
MQDSSNSKDKKQDSSSDKTSPKKEYVFGGIQEFSLEKIEDSILEESVYLDVFAGSDINFKEEIRPLENILSSISDLNVITYNYRVDEYTHKGFPETRQLGVIAQEVQAVFPELVRKDKDGDLQVNYSQLSTIAIQAVKELSSLLEKTNERITQLEKKLSDSNKI